jgi:lysophospholipase L1-like esterase
LQVSETVTVTLSAGERGQDGVQGDSGVQGATGLQGATGATGSQGVSGTTAVTSPLTRSGSAENATIGLDTTTLEPAGLSDETKATLAGTIVASPAVVAKAQYGVRTVFLGDSYFATVEATTGTAGTAGSVISYPARNPITWADFWLGGALNRVGNFGGSGEQTSQWAARYESQVPAAKPDIVIMGSAGINDMNNGKTPAQTMAILSGMFDRNAQLGALTVMLGPVPFGDSTMAQRTYIHTMAALLRREAQTRRNFILIDCHPAVSDMSDADLWLGLPAAKYTADGIHFGLWGAMRVGKLIAEALRRVIPPAACWPSGSASSYSTIDKNLIANAGLTGTAGTLANGATGVVATSWGISSQSGATFSGTVDCSIVPRTDFKGGAWQQVKLAGAAGDAQFSQNISTGFTPGKKYRAIIEIDSTDYQPTGGSGALRFRFQSNMTGGSAGANGLDLSGADESLGFATDLLLGRGLAITPIIIPDSSAWRLQVTMLMRGTGTIRFGRPALIEVN